MERVYLIKARNDKGFYEQPSTIAICNDKEKAYEFVNKLNGLLKDEYKTFLPGAHAVVYEMFVYDSDEEITDDKLKSLIINISLYC